MNLGSWTRPEGFHQCQGRFENVLCQATLAGDVGCLKGATDLNMLKEALAQISVWCCCVSLGSYGVLHTIGSDHKTHTLQWLFFNRRTNTHPQCSEPRPLMIEIASKHRGEKRLVVAEEL
eukprot:superscaffoldBa00002916_g15639